MLVDRTGTFRGKILDHGISTTKKGFPQWIVQLVATEIFDEDEQVWVDWSEYDVNEITAYLVLFGGKGETLTCQQVKKITGWPGLSFSTLDAMDLSKTGIQFRVEDNTYEGKTTKQVSWVDEFDAAPGRAVRKLNPEDMQALEAQYASVLKGSSKKASPAKAKKVTAKGIAPTQPKGPVTKGAKDPLGPPTPLPPDPSLPAGHCTKDEAWGAVYELKAKDVDDEQIAKTWCAALKDVAPSVEQEDVTDEQWFMIKEKVLSETAIF